MTAAGATYTVDAPGVAYMDGQMTCRLIVIVVLMCEAVNGV